MKYRQILSTSILFTLGLLLGFTVYVSAEEERFERTQQMLIEKLQESRRAFEYANDLNPDAAPGEIESEPVKGKKESDKLTAAEFNRVLEMLTALENGDLGGGPVWEDVPLTDTDPFDMSCQYRSFLDFDARSTTYMGSQKNVRYSFNVNSNFIGDSQIHVTTGGLTYGIQSSNKAQYGWRSITGSWTADAQTTVTKMEKLCLGTDSAAPDVTPDTPTPTPGNSCNNATRPNNTTGMWFSGNPSSANQAFTYSGSKTAAGSCRWGCRAGYSKDGNKCTQDPTKKEVRFTTYRWEGGGWQAKDTRVRTFDLNEKVWIGARTSYADCQSTGPNGKSYAVMTYKNCHKDDTYNAGYRTGGNPGNKWVQVKDKAGQSASAVDNEQVNGMIMRINAETIRLK